MDLYKITVSLKSPLATPLKGDTIWGHIVWGIANNEGDEKVAEFLELSKTSTPPLIVSSAFPKGKISKHIPNVKPREDYMSKDKYAEIKQAKKEKFVCACEYLDLPPFSENENESGSFSSFATTRNSINRMTNSVIDDGGLYSVNEFWTETKDWDIYLRSSLDKKRINQLFEWAFEFGYGADASVGRGNIAVLQNSLTQIQPKAKSKNGGDGSQKYMALAPFVIGKNDEINNLRANIFVRNGKIGGAFGGVLSPYKKGVILYDEGAVFESKNTQIMFVGELLENVHSDEKIKQSGFAPVIPIDDDCSPLLNT